MTESQLSSLLESLLSVGREAEWLEFKHNKAVPQEIGEYVSALANSAALHGVEMAYLIWGIEDDSLRIQGTSFRPREAKGKGGEDLEPWLARGLTPQLDFRFHEWVHQDAHVVLLQIPAASGSPVSFCGGRFIRVGSYKKPLKDYPAKEKALWNSLAETPFESGIAKHDVTADEVLELIDFAGCLDLLKIALPSTTDGILRRLADEQVVARKPGDRHDVTNLGAILFAKDLGRFGRLGRKAVRIIRYKGSGRLETEREWRDPPSRRGYALAFDPAVAFINSLTPQNELIGRAFRTEDRMFPELAIRELVANALIHQDFSVSGAGPMVEVFDRRIEITNPGESLVDPLRFIDTPPRSRNETLAALMRRMGLCEESGRGVDRAVEAIELHQLPAPDFQVVKTMQPGSTKVTLYAYEKLSDMSSKDRIRACYQHACLRFMSNEKLTNASLRKRLGVEEQNAAMASRIIRETIKAELMKPFDPDANRRYLSYVPFWA